VGNILGKLTNQIKTLDSCSTRKF